MSLDKPLLFDVVEEETEGINRTYGINWETGRIGGKIDNLDAVKQFIKKALITPRFKCLIYDNQYGSEIKDTVLGKKITKEYLETEMTFLIEDTIIHDERILKVYDVEFFYFDSPNKDVVKISFSVDTIYGVVEAEEVI